MSQFPTGNPPLASHKMQTPLWFNGDFHFPTSVLISLLSGPYSLSLAALAFLRIQPQGLCTCSSFAQNVFPLGLHMWPPSFH